MSPGAAAAAVLFVAICLAPVNATPVRSEMAIVTPLPDDWLSVVNEYRALANLPPVTEDPILSEGHRKHARYMVETDHADHFEFPESPWYTPEGNEAAATGVLVSSSGATVSDRDAIEGLMQAPFHAFGILTPNMATTGYGSYRDQSSPAIQMAAGMDVRRGVSPVPSPIPFPIFWPGNGEIVPLTSFPGPEHPDPLTACPGYIPPTGLPTLLQLSETPQVTAHSFLADGVSEEHCLFDETTYVNPNPDEQQRGRAILGEASRHAVVLIPRYPLRAGVTYTVSINANGTPVTWSFRVLDRTPPAPVVPAPFQPPPLHVPVPLPTPTSQLCLGIPATRIGTSGPETLTGTPGADVILGLGGDDRIDGGGGNDVICAGVGNDLLVGGTGNDHLDGEAGNDTASFPEAKRVRVDLAAGTASGGSIDVLSGIENVIGSPGKDILKGSAGPNLLSGLAGADFLLGRSGNDTLIGGNGRDSLNGGRRSDVCDGGKGVDAAQSCERLRGIP